MYMYVRIIHVARLSHAYVLAHVQSLNEFSCVIVSICTCNNASSTIDLALACFSCLWLHKSQEAGPSPG